MYPDGQGLVTIRMKPDSQGRFGFNVKVRSSMILFQYFHLNRACVQYSLCSMDFKEDSALSANFKVDMASRRVGGENDCVYYASKAEYIKSQKSR